MSKSLEVLLKITKTIRSCRTTDQLNVATNMVFRVSKARGSMFYREKFEIWTHLIEVMSEQRIIIKEREGKIFNYKYC